ncbi:MAG: DcaP family trimeric outer membrane transporter [Bacteroidota bacterium]|nr:DcaP family trimeric outer membrane transporter [Bacteroidota bacterium]
MKTSNDTLSSKDVHPQDSPEESGFFLSSKNKKASLRIYGSARLFGAYDINGLQGGTGFSIADIPVDEEDKNERTFYMTANLTRFGFEAKREAPIGDALIRVETDFNGTDNKFRIRQAYGQTKFLIIGQTWTGFSDIETLPITVDVDGPPTAVSLRTVQIKYYLDFKPGWRFRASVESPSVAVYVPDTISIEAVSQNYPAVVANIKKDWKPVQVKVAGIFNPVSVRNLTGERTSLFGGGALLCINTNFLYGSSLKFQGLLGEGIASFLNLADNAAFDVFLNPSTGAYELTACYGGFIAFNQNLIPKTLDVDVVYGLVGFNMEDYFPGNTFKSGQYVGSQRISELSGWFQNQNGVYLRF